MQLERGKLCMLGCTPDGTAGMSVKAFRTSCVAKGLQAADEGDEGGMPRGPSSCNSRSASSASTTFGFKLLLLLTSTAHAI